MASFPLYATKGSNPFFLFRSVWQHWFSTPLLLNVESSDLFVSDKKSTTHLVSRWHWQTHKGLVVRGIRARTRHLRRCHRAWHERWVLHSPRSCIGLRLRLKHQHFRNRAKNATALTFNSMSECQWTFTNNTSHHFRKRKWWTKNDIVTRTWCYSSTCLSKGFP